MKIETTVNKDKEFSTIELNKHACCKNATYIQPAVVASIFMPRTLTSPKGAYIAKSSYGRIIKVLLPFW